MFKEPGDSNGRLDNMFEGLEDLFNEPCNASKAKRFASVVAALPRGTRSVIVPCALNIGPRASGQGPRTFRSFIGVAAAIVSD